MNAKSNEYAMFAEVRPSETDNTYHVRVMVPISDAAIDPTDAEQYYKHAAPALIATIDPDAKRVPEITLLGMNGAELYRGSMEPDGPLSDMSREVMEAWPGNYCGMGLLAAVICNYTEVCINVLRVASALGEAGKHVGVSIKTRLLATLSKNETILSSIDKSTGKEVRTVTPRSISGLDEDEDESDGDTVEINGRKMPVTRFDGECAALRVISVDDAMFPAPGDSGLSCAPRALFAVGDGVTPVFRPLEEREVAFLTGCGVPDEAIKALAGCYVFPRICTAIKQSDEGVYMAMATDMPLFVKNVDCISPMPDFYGPAKLYEAINGHAATNVVTKDVADERNKEATPAFQQLATAPRIDTRN